MKDKKICIHLDGVIYKRNQSEFSEQEMDDLIDEIIGIIDKRKYTFGGGYALYTEDQYFKKAGRR